ncbi:Kelch repeat-containing protein, partial [Kitasatospora sp. NPDC059088]|uniref:Kelch repeat-containing protein n=1 Tax=Kitasatospora sp. NPDC059088 TaxID=3346722 RepID=UPI00369091DB
PTGPPPPPRAPARRAPSVRRSGAGGWAAGGGRSADSGAPGPALGTAEVYDPAPGTWAPTAGALTTARHGHAATVLPDGRLLVTGGTGTDGRALATVELLDPVARTWSAAGPPMTDARTGHRAVLLRNGKVLVVGGALPTGGPDAALAHCELHDPATGSWTPTGSLLTARKGHQATLLADGRVLVTGGDPAAGPVTDPGGYDPHSLATAEVYDPATGTWTALGPMPGGRRGHRCLALRSGLVLLIGGTGGPAFAAGHRNVTVLDPALGTWTATGPLATGRSDFAAVELADGRVLVAGGTALAGAAAPGPAPTEPAATAELYAP